MTIADQSDPKRETKAEIEAFLSSRIRNVEFGADDNIFDSGLVNSLFALQLINFVEGRFKFEIPDEELLIDNFNSIQAIANFVERMERDRP